MFKPRYSTALHNTTTTPTPSDSTATGALRKRIRDVDNAYRRKALAPFVPCELGPADAERIENRVFERCHGRIVRELMSDPAVAAQPNPYYEYVKRMQERDDSIWVDIRDSFAAARTDAIEIDANEAEVFHFECHIRALERVIQIYGADAQTNPDSASTVMFALRLVLPLILHAPSVHEFVARRLQLLRDKFVTETGLIILDAFNSGAVGVPGVAAAHILYGVGEWY